MNWKRLYEMKHRQFVELEQVLEEFIREHDHKALVEQATNQQIAMMKKAQSDFEAQQERSRLQPNRVFTDHLEDPPTVQEHAQVTSEPMSADEMKAAVGEIPEPPTAA